VALRTYAWLGRHAGHDSPDGPQHLLCKAKWDTDGVRDDLRGYVVERLGGDGAVLVMDETGDVKKGMHTSVCGASTPAPQGGSRTPRSRCI
jgi:SRSO17 transposase